ncbi:putative G-protein coupled receptor No9 [Fasciola hepatica]|uniref:G-protein coupled receptor No9 n=1 Tax=Fasciola hepatica TaxID=6192 RepID=A0A4E0R7G9_FASHE|nr:putative G-protein coupled receptor No9 [Fasciola hepatica]
MLSNFVDLILTLTMLGLVCLVGTLGNSLVLGVYLRQYLFPQTNRFRRKVWKTEPTTNGALCLESLSDRSAQKVIEDDCTFTRTTGTPTFFILVLACVDLLVCCFVVPLTFYMEYVEMKPPSDVWCKIHSFVCVCNTMFSALLVIAIALDRYLAICHPLHPMLTMKRAKILTAALAVFCIIYGFLGLGTIQLAPDSSDPTEMVCTDTGDLLNTTQAQKYFYLIVQKGNTASFVMAILFVLILYSLILKVVIKAHRRIRKMQEQSAFPKRQSKSNSLPQFGSVDGAADSSYGADNVPRPSRPRMRFSIRGLTESGLWREMRSASVLFVVAVVYIIVFTPSLLTANKLVTFTLIGYNSFFLNNMSNPLIYCFMSRAFRVKLQTLFSGLCSHKMSTPEEALFSQTTRKRPRSTIQTVITEHSGSPV